MQYYKHQINSGNLCVAIKYRGRGIALAAWNLVLNYLLDNSFLSLVTAGSREINLPMIHLMEKSGMTIECKLKSRFIVNNKRVGMLCASKEKM